MHVTANSIKAPADGIKDLEPVLKRLQHGMQRAAFGHRFLALGTILGIGSLAWYAGGKDFVATAVARGQIGVAERQAKVRQE